MSDLREINFRRSFSEFEERVKKDKINLDQLSRKERILKRKSAVDIFTLRPPINRTDEDLLRLGYEDHPKALKTYQRDSNGRVVLNEQGEPILSELKGVVFPADEFRELLENKTHIKYVYLEFCNHRFLDGEKDEFSIMITGLDDDYFRVKEEDGESRVYEFAQSCPDRCPK
ncbi:MAG: hypothetical protein HWE22_02840 [Flavobacteriales bacterium]|nr:hypothetical protein [Flavobacteriales bacterium]